MPRPNPHQRVHSFPPARAVVQRRSKHLTAPEPDSSESGFQYQAWRQPTDFHIPQAASPDHVPETDPLIYQSQWNPFLYDTDSSEEEDYLCFNAGILSSTSSSCQKKKQQKFRPATKAAPPVLHHHGFFSTNAQHGFVHNHTGGLEPGVRKRERRHQRVDSVHRRSWQEPSEDLFTVDEEASQVATDVEEDLKPQIMVCDYDYDGSDEVGEARRGPGAHSHGQRERSYAFRSWTRPCEPQLGDADHGGAWKRQSLHAAALREPPCPPRHP